MVTSDVRARFADEGYLVVEDVLSDEELSALRDATETLHAERSQAGGETGTAVIQDVVFKGDAFMATARHPRMLEIVTELIGPNLQLQHCKLNWKPASKGAGEVRWHQDFPFFPHTNYDMLAVMFLLDDATPDNGCMRMIPGSHKEGAASQRLNGEWTPYCTDPHRYEGREYVDLKVRAGSITIHHCLTLHSSYPNNSANPRRGLVFQIRASDAIQVGGNVLPCTGLQLAGDPSLTARCVAGDIALPFPLTHVAEGIDY